MHRAIAAFFIVLLITASLSACARPATTTLAEDLPALKTIIVLPTEIEADGPGGRPAAEARQLARGQILFDTMLAEYFTNRPEITLLGAGQRGALDKDLNRNRTAAALAICRAAKADAVLLLTLHRFHEREGSEYSIVSPAAVEFDYKLIHGATGQSLCSGIFSETQQPLLDDIFQFFKKAKRGVRWLSAEELAREGFSQKISDCPPLKK